jgi:hypothetical protein
MLVRRLLLLAAVLMLLTALAAGLAPRQSSNNAPTVERSSVPAGKPVTKNIDAESGKRNTVRVRRGDQLQLTVSGDTLDTVLIERLDRIRAIEPTTPARFDILIDAAAGDYPIRLVDADRRIGRLVITD